MESPSSRTSDERDDPHPAPLDESRSNSGSSDAAFGLACKRGWAGARTSVSEPDSSPFLLGRSGDQGGGGAAISRLICAMADRSIGGASLGGAVSSEHEVPHRASEIVLIEREEAGVQRRGGALGPCRLPAS